MALHTAAHTAGGVEDAVSARLAAAGLWALNGPGPLDVRTGVVYAPGNPFTVAGTSSTSPWTVTVSPGTFVGSKGGGNGPYFATNDGSVTVNLSVPPGSNSRIDTIYAMQTDPAAIISPDASGPSAVIDKVEGTSGNGGLGSSPTAPAVPAGAVALATVQIQSTATNGTSGAGVTITPVFSWTTTRGGPIPVRNATERDNTLQYPKAGDETLRLDRNGAIEHYVNGAWNGWASYTPAWHADTTDPNVGTGGSLVGSWRYDRGEVEVWLLITVGSSGVGQGSGNYYFSLPVPADLTSPFGVTGSGLYTPGGANYPIVPSLKDANNTRFFATTGAGQTLSYSTPAAFTTGTTLRAYLKYKAA